ncbi:protein kinase domain-containing protein [Brachybacterium sp. DNPG3]
MSSRPPSAPPRLPGYEYETLLGSGGFADVFLYRQFRPQRRVAIKVLLSDVLDDSVRRQFDAEANVMATMSTHPSIVSIHAAEISADHRPYIVMEYCSRPNYGVRFRRERITVAEALRVGVQIAGAVETAHRAGILHRDIKPANILVTDYSRPALTDFGISIAAGAGDDIDDSQGMSIPWSPPEFFADPPRADVRSDVFSLAATVYSLLASRTPFERPGQRNSAADLIHRIETEPLRPLERPDVPAELNRVLSIAMAKDPGGRYDTALSFGRGLQQIEMALSLPVTQMDVLDDRGGALDREEDDALELHTRIRKVATVDPEGPGTSDGDRAAAAPVGQADAPAAPAHAADGRRPGVDRFAGIAPALGEDPYRRGDPAPGNGPTGAPASGPGSAPGAAYGPPVEESTMLRPVATATGGPADADAVPADRERRSGTPAWPFIALAALVVIALGAGATAAVGHFFGEPEEIIATTDPNAVVTDRPEALEVTDAAIAITVSEADGGGFAYARISWELPEEAGSGATYRVRWTDLPDGYQEYEQFEMVRGRKSVTLKVPPGVDPLCAEVQTVFEDPSAASGWVPVCLEDEEKVD